MKCVICKIGETQPGLVTVTHQQRKTTVIFKEVPAEICENCGDYYLSEEVTEKLLARAEEAAKKGTEVEILKFAA